MSSTDVLSISEQREDDQGIVLSLSGNLNSTTATQLRNRLQECFSGNTQCIQLLLDALTGADSAGIAALVEGLRWSRKENRRFVLSGMNEAVRDRVMLFKLEDQFEIVSDGPSS